MTLCAPNNWHLLLTLFMFDIKITKYFEQNRKLCPVEENIIGRHVQRHIILESPLKKYTLVERLAIENRKVGTK